MLSTHPLDDPSLRPLLSPVRLATYEAACGGDVAQAMRLYAWNIEASAALWGGFSVLEVCLRNAMSLQLEAYTKQADWWNSPRVKLRAEQQAAVTTASSNSPGQVVSSLTFGFWSSLLANRYHQQLWVPSLHLAFPYLVGRRGTAHQDLEHLRRLRNRLAHHEPIFGRDLLGDHKMTIKVLSWINPAASEWVKRDSRLPGVAASQSITVTGNRKTTF